MRGSRYIGRIPYLFGRVARYVDESDTDEHFLRRAAALLVMRYVFTSVVVDVLMHRLRDDVEFMKSCRDFIELFERVYRVHVPRNRGVVITAMMVLDVVVMDDSNEVLVDGRRLFINKLVSSVMDNVHAAVEETIIEVQKHVDRRSSSSLFLASHLNTVVVKTLELVPYEEHIIREIANVLLIFLGMMLDGVGESVDELSDSSCGLRSEICALELFVCTENRELSSGMRMSIVDDTGGGYSHVVGGDSVVNVTHGAFSQFFNPRFYMDCFCVDTSSKIISSVMFVHKEISDESSLVGSRCTRKNKCDMGDYSFISLKV